MISLKILFKNQTKYSVAIYEKFLAFHRKKYHFPYVAYTIMVVSFILISLILQIKSHQFNLAVLLCCALTFFILWRYLHPISQVSKEYKSNKIQKEKEFTFKFYYKFFTVTNQKEIFKIKYYELYKIFETRDFFYLYIDKTHAFLIDKSKFTLGSCSDFSTFIRKKYWWKYKKTYYAS